MTADEIRAMGWTLAVHNDYRQDGEPHTFWLFTKDGQAVKGEGRTDADALNKVRAALASPHPAGTREALIEQCAKIADKFSAEVVPTGMKPPSGAWRISQDIGKAIRALAHLPVTDEAGDR